MDDVECSEGKRVASWRVMRAKKFKWVWVVILSTLTFHSVFVSITAENLVLIPGETFLNTPWTHHSANHSSFYIYSST